MDINNVKEHKVTNAVDNSFLWYIILYNNVLPEQSTFNDTFFFYSEY